MSLDRNNFFSYALNRWSHSTLTHLMILFRVGRLLLFYTNKILNIASFISLWTSCFNRWLIRTISAFITCSTTFPSFQILFCLLANYRHSLSTHCPELLSFFTRLISPRSNFTVLRTVKIPVSFQAKKNLSRDSERGISSWLYLKENKFYCYFLLSPLSLSSSSITEEFLRPENMQPAISHSLSLSPISFRRFMNSFFTIQNILPFHYLYGALEKRKHASLPAPKPKLFI